MKSLNDEELRRSEQNSEDWLPPHEFARKVEALDRQIKSCERFNPRRSSSSFAMMRGVLLAQFCAAHESGQRALSPAANRRRRQRRLRQNLKAMFENPGNRGGRDEARERGKEYRPNASTFTDEQINNAEYVARALRGPIKKRLRNTMHRHRQRWIVNLNLGVHGSQEQETKLASLIAEIKEQYRPNFAGIYVLRDDRLF